MSAGTGTWSKYSSPADRSALRCERRACGSARSPQSPPRCPDAPNHRQHARSRNDRRQRVSAASRDLAASSLHRTSATTTATMSANIATTSDLRARRAARPASVAALTAVILASSIRSCSSFLSLIFVVAAGALPGSAWAGLSFGLYVPILFLLQLENGQRELKRIWPARVRCRRWAGPAAKLARRRPPRPLERREMRRTHQATLMAAWSSQRMTRRSPTPRALQCAYQAANRLWICPCG